MIFRRKTALLWNIPGPLSGLIPKRPSPLPAGAVDRGQVVVMHIPDGYLSPKTCGVFYAVMVPLWYIAAAKVERALGQRRLALVALGAAFTFVIMMFNVPIPGGSTGHMVGGAVVAIVLGPWAGMVALTLALSLQALLFGDGGITTLAANCFNMAVVMSFSGYYTYRLLVPERGAGRTRMLAASALAGYLAVNLAALAVAVELGIQPLIAKSATGTPLYAPYPLKVTVPAMMIPHLLFFGPIEALGTAAVVLYIHRFNEALFYHAGGAGLKPLWKVLAVLVVLTPLGILASGSPWGEWGVEELRDLVGYIPEGMKELGGLWKGLMPGYSLPGGGGAFVSFAAYVLSAAIGSLLLVGAVYIWARMMRRR